MSQFQKAVLATVCLVACIASLTVLAIAKVEGAALAVVGIVTAIVGFYTRETRSGDAPKNDNQLPPGAAMIPLLAASIAMGALSGGCSALLGDKAAQAEESYRAQQLKCVDDYNTRAQIDECRRVVREEWGIVETAAKDGGK